MPSLRTSPSAPSIRDSSPRTKEWWGVQSGPREYSRSRAGEGRGVPEDIGHQEVDGEGAFGLASLSAPTRPELAVTSQAYASRPPGPGDTMRRADRPAQHSARLLAAGGACRPPIIGADRVVPPLVAGARITTDSFWPQNEHRRLYLKLACGRHQIRSGRFHSGAAPPYRPPGNPTFHRNPGLPAQFGPTLELDARGAHDKGVMAGETRCASQDWRAHISHHLRWRWRTVGPTLDIVSWGHPS